MMIEKRGLILFLLIDLFLTFLSLDLASAIFLQEENDESF
jgi:hypothetical protein